MVKLHEFKQTASFTWSSDTLPLFATGTLAGAVDANFSNDSRLSIYSPFTEGSTPLADLNSDSKFNSLAWGKPSATYEKGLLAAALEDNTVQLWDASKLLKDGASLTDANVAKYKKHTKSVNVVRFNPKQDNILASAGCSRELYIWDVSTGTATLPGQFNSPIDKISSFSWNNSVSQIFAIAGDSGYASIWDLKARKEVLQIGYSTPHGRSNITVVDWHPTENTKLVTASDNDGHSIICTWDLRNANAPEKILEGHIKGVLSLDWCRQDPSLLLSSGKDNSTVLWNPIKGLKLCEYPSAPNWVHQAKFAPSTPDVFATASFDKKVVIQTLQDTCFENEESSAPKTSTSNDDDFWSELSTTDNQHPKIIVSQAPEWLKRPVSATFGYGGKLITVNNKTSSVSITKFERDDIFVDTKEILSKAIETGDFTGVCSSKSQTTGDWNLLKSLLDKGEMGLLSEILDDKKVEGDNEEKDDEVKSEETDKAVTEEDDDDFFNNLGSEIAAAAAKQEETSNKYVPTGEFSLFKESADFENDTVRALMIGNFEKAIDLCIGSDHIMEALIIANHRPEWRQKAEAAYFKKYAKDSSLSRILHGLSIHDPRDIVVNGDITSWKEIARCLMAFKRDKTVFQENMTILADRLISSSVENSRENALVCYMAGGSLDKLAKIWFSEFKSIETSFMENDTTGIKSPYDAHIMTLSEILEKIMVYQSTVKDYSPSSFRELDEAYREYSEALVNYGYYELAFKLLQSLPESNEGVKLAKQRISKAFMAPEKSAATRASMATTSPNVTRNPMRQSVYSLPNAGTSMNPSTAPLNSFNPMQQSSAMDSKPYGGIATPSSAFNNGLPPTMATTSNPIPNLMPQPPQGSLNGVPYNPLVGNSALPPSNGMPPQRRTSVIPNNPYKPKTAMDSLIDGPSTYSAGTATGSPLPPQPQAFKPLPPQKVKKDVGGWNDLPTALATPPAVTRAAAQPAVPSAYSFQVSQSPSRSHSRAASQPPSMPAPPKARTSQPPTPKMPPATTAAPRPNKYAPPPQFSNGSNGVDASPPPPSTTPHLSRQISNPYAPKGEITSPVTVPLPHTNISSSTPVASVAPPRNPYAPKFDSHPAPTSNFAPQPRAFGGAAASPMQEYPPQAMGMNAPPPMPQTSMYAPSPQQQQTSMYAPPPQSNAYAPPAAPGGSFPPPPQTTTMSSIPPPPQTSSIPPPPPSASTAPPSNAKPSSGDRSRITPDLLPIYQTLTSEFERVKPKIPEKFSKQITDSEKRLNMLYDHLNNRDLLSNETLSELNALCAALSSGDFKTAKAIQANIANTKAGECGNWMLGVKRLIGFAEAVVNL